MLCLWNDKNSYGCCCIPKLLVYSSPTILVLPVSLTLPSTFAHQFGGNINLLLTPPFLVNMILCQANRNIQKVGQQDLVRKNESKQTIHTIVCFDWSLIETRPQGIKKERLQPPCRSARLRPGQEQTVSKNTNIEPKLPLPSPTINTLGKEVWNSFSNMLQS